MFSTMRRTSNTSAGDDVASLKLSVAGDHVTTVETADLFVQHQLLSGRRVLLQAPQQVL